MLLGNKMCVKSAESMLSCVHVSEGTAHLSENTQSRTLIKLMQQPLQG